MNLDRLRSYNKKAKKAESEDAREESRRREALKEKKKVNTRGRKPYDFMVYWAMNSVRRIVTPGRALVFAFLNVPPFFGAIYFFIASLDHEVTAFVYWGRVLTAVMVLVYLIYLLRHKIYCIMTYPFFINWDKKLPFPVQGWDDLVSSDNFNDLSFWRTECGVTIYPKEDTKEFKELIHSIFYLFCRRTRPVLEAFESGDAEAWGYDHYTLSGRSNSTIAGYLYEMIKKDLKKVVKETGNIEGVSIYCSVREKEYEKAVPLSDTDSSGM